MNNMERYRQWINCFSFLFDVNVADILIDIAHLRKRTNCGSTLKNGFSGNISMTFKYACETRVKQNFN